MTIDIKELLSKLLLNQNDSFIKYVYEEACGYDAPHNITECEYKFVEPDIYTSNFRWGDTENPKVGDIIITDTPTIQEGLEGDPIVNYVVIEHKETGLKFLFREWLKRNTEKNFYSTDDECTEFLGIVNPKIIEYQAFEIIESIDTLKESLLKHLDKKEEV